MDFIEHTKNWLKGENFEMLLILFSGLAFLLVSGLLWKYSTTVNGKALVIPIFFIGLLYCAGIGYGLYENNQRMQTFEQLYATNAVEFVKQEKTRVEAFQSLYTYSAIFSGVMFFMTVFVFLFIHHTTIQSIAIALMIIAASLILIDYFSKERSTTYYEHIMLELKTINNE